jgi:hypothetical protein
MKHLLPGPQLFLLSLVSAAALTLACGSSPKQMQVSGCPVAVTSPSSNTTGVLQSISLCPATANAENFPDGEVQFTAGGVYNTAPKYVSPLKTYGWGACQAGVSTNDVVISQTGLAHCAAGASGVYSVYTSVATACNAVGPCGTGCLISGYAQLTCP